LTFDWFFKNGIYYPFSGPSLSPCDPHYKMLGLSGAPDLSRKQTNLDSSGGFGFDDDFDMLLEGSLVLRCILFCPTSHLTLQEVAKTRARRKIRRRKKKRYMKRKGRPRLLRIGTRYTSHQTSSALFVSVIGMTATITLKICSQSKPRALNLLLLQPKFLLKQLGAPTRSHRQSWTPSWPQVIALAFCFMKNNLCCHVELGLSLSDSGVSDNNNNTVEDIDSSADMLDSMLGGTGGSGTRGSTASARGSTAFGSGAGSSRNSRNSRRSPSADGNDGARKVGQ
jgi:hypothetical protein